MFLLTSRNQNTKKVEHLSEERRKISLFTCGHKGLLTLSDFCQEEDNMKSLRSYLKRNILEWDEFRNESSYICETLNNDSKYSPMSILLKFVSTWLRKLRKSKGCFLIYFHRIHYEIWVNQKNSSISELHISVQEHRLSCMFLTCA